MKDITPKQMLLLYVLACVLVVVVSVKYLILPANAKYKQEQKNYETVEAKYELLELQSSYASIYKTHIEELTGDINELKSGFQPVLADEDIDKLVTDLIYNNSMKTEMLFINQTVEYTDESLNYVNDNTAAADGQPTTTIATTTTTTTTTTASGNQQDAQNTQTENAAQNVKVSSVNVTVNGKYVDFVNLINNIKSTKGLTVSDVSFSTDNDASPMSNIVVSFVVKIYMYDDSNLNADTANQQG